MSVVMHDGRVKLYHGDSRDILKELPDNSIDSCVCDPPYALVSIQKRFGKPGSAPAKGNDAYMRASAGFMGANWDVGETAFAETFWAEVLRVLKPGGHVVAFSGTRTYHRMAVAIEDAGFEIRDQLGWVYGCLDDQTMAVTSNGVMPYHKIKKGDLVLSYDPTYMSYEWQPVEEVLVYDVDDTAYRISTDLGDQLVSRNHRCIVERGGEEVFELAEEAARQREIRIPVLENLRALLDAVSNAHSGTGEPQQDVFEGVRGRDNVSSSGILSETGGDAQGEVGRELRGVWDGVLAQYETSEARQDAGVQLPVQRSFSRGGVEGARTYGARELDAGVGRGSCGEDDGRDESGVEGRSYVQESEGELRVGSIRALPGRFSSDVAQGRVCDGASPECGDGDRSSSDAGGVRTPYQPRPAEQRSDEPDAVRDEQGPQAVRAWRGHKTVVGRITPERYRGVIWCVRVKSGAFVAVRNGFAFPTGNSGFPKSHNQKGDWEGWGTALKPAWEPICLARKALDGTVAANLEAWGVGAINVDGCRVEAPNKGWPKTRRYAPGQMAGGEGYLRGKTVETVDQSDAGRWPANIVHDGSDEVLAAFPDTKSGLMKAGTVRAAQDVPGSVVYGVYGGDAAKADTYGDSGSAARFFYAAKASRADRDAGLSSFETKTVDVLAGHRSRRMEEVKRPDGATPATGKNTHPTVKPTSLCQWLCRLVTPPGGVILDPFMGSGSTGKAAVLEGFQFVGCEREDEYMPIATARIAWAIGAVGKEDERPAVATQQPAANDNDLFSAVAA